jgi:hypothetical protein
VNRHAAALSARQTAKDRATESKGALEGATGIDDGTLRAEHFKRLRTCIAAERECSRLNAARSAQESAGASQEAFCVQSELLKFVRSPRKYARNPPNLAGAMAGLPDVSASYGFQRCSARPNPSWPFFNFRIFKLISETWSRVGSATSDALAPALRTTVLSLPADDPVRRQLVLEWRYLRLALEDAGISITDDRAALPFKIYAAYCEKRAVAQTREETVRAQMERLESPG